MEYTDIDGVEPTSFSDTVDDLDLDEFTPDGYAEAAANAAVKPSYGGSGEWFKMKDDVATIRVASVPLIVYRHNKFKDDHMCVRLMLKKGETIDTGKPCKWCIQADKDAHKEFGDDSKMPPAMPVAYATIIVRGEPDKAFKHMFRGTQFQELAKKMVDKEFYGDPRQYDIRISKEFRTDGKVKGYTFDVPRTPFRPLNTAEEVLVADLDFQPLELWKSMVKKELEALKA